MLTDRLAWVAGCLLVPLFLSVGLSAAGNEAKGFLITGPKQVLPGSQETYCLHLHGIQSAGKVHFRIAHNKFKIYVGSPSTTRIDPKINDYNKCIPIALKIPANLQSGNYEAVFQIDWDDASETLKTFTKKEIVVSSAPQNLLLIQTDKAWYTPGQLVRFRTLALTHVLQPVLTPPKRVWITDPKESVVFEWNNVTANLGLLQLELQLSPEPIQGVWKIHVENGGVTQTKEFEVKNFVLPSYEVKIDAPKSFVGRDETLNFSVCAKSTAGQPILGTVDAVVKLQPRVAWFGPITTDANVKPVTVAGKLNEGCLQTAVPLSSLVPEGDLWSSIEITGHVTEDGTGAKRNASVTVSVAPQGGSNIIVETSQQNPSSFKTGLPYFGQGRVFKVGENGNENGEPIANASINICIIEGIPNLGLTNGDPVFDVEAVVCHRSLTDDQGKFKYTILQKKPETVRLSLTLTYKNENRNLSSSLTTTIKAAHSLSGSFAVIASGAEQTVTCNSKLALKAYFNNVKPGTKLDLHYIVTSRGDVLEHGTKTAVEVKSFNQELYGFAFGPTSPVKLNGVELEIQLTPSFYPRASIMVYYVREDGEVVAAQTQIKVNECFPNPVNLHWNVDHEAPGAIVKLNGQSTPGSLCGLSVVDQSVTLVKPDSQLTEKNVFDQIGSFIIEPFYQPSQQTFDYIYCEKQEDPEHTVNVNTEVKETSEDTNGTWSKASVHEDVIEAFDRAGLMVISNFNLETRPCYSYFTEHKPTVLHGIPGGRPPPIPDFESPAPAPETEVVVTEETVPATLPVEEHVYFPDTLLWDLRTVDDTGSFTIEEKLPNKATSWVGRALCISDKTGFGMSTEAKITAVGKH